MSTPPESPSVTRLGDDADEPVSILIVDDRHENRLALRAILEQPGYRLVEASSGPEALRRLLDEEFAVLLLDVVMPDMSGFELAAAIKERERTATVPIIFLTAHATDSELIYKGYGAGAVDYLVKPLASEMVRSKVAVFADIYRKERRLLRQAERLLAAERRESEVQLLELRLASERHYRSLADAVPNITWTAGPDGKVDYFNQRWFEYTGISAARSGGSWCSALHEDDRHLCESAWGESLRSGRTFETECRLRRAADGAFRWHLGRALPERGFGGAIVSWLGTFTDVDDQKRASEALAEFKGTLDAVLDAVLICEPEQDRFVYANAGAAVLLGCPQGDLLGLRLVDFVVEDDTERFRQVLGRLRAGAARRVALETRCRRRDGKELPVDFSFQVVRAEHVVAIARDITNRKLAEFEREQLYDQALQAIRTRDEFLSIATHELRTPLSSLKLQLGLLLRASKQGAQSPTELVPKLEGATKQVERLALLVSELMDMSRIRAGRLRLEPEPADLVAIARDVVMRFREDAVRAGCEVTLRAGGFVRGTWDPIRVDQVVANLLANALKFGAGKPVEIEVAVADGKARLVVRDHGIGIAAENIGRVFEPFERAVTGQKYPGTGLGLYIVRQIIDAHGGTIRVESAPGAGTTFVVDLPTEPPSA